MIIEIILAIDESAVQNTHPDIQSAETVNQSKLSQAELVQDLKQIFGNGHARIMSFDGANKTVHVKANTSMSDKDVLSALNALPGVASVSIAND